ncbi:MAG TPA: zinc ribbon domain-containing protein [Candidatus Nanoarchaeia archaeon]|nr:zinc ribbon domain-containing protein [Candidatus Nanoarchaeia archaeon]
MAKIHGLVFIAAGLFMAVLSSILNFQRFIFFFLAGLAFLIYGIAKIVINFIGGNKTELQAQPHRINQQAHHPHLQHKLTHPPQYKYCPRCNTVLRFNDRFCRNCGSRV